MTIYAHVAAGTVDSVGQPPNLVYQGGRWYDIRDRDLATMAIVGWYPVVEAAKPADTATTRWETHFEQAGSVVNQWWAEVVKTQAELDADVAAAALTAQRAAVKTIVTELQTEKARVQPVIDLLNSATVTTVQIKDIAKAAKRIADAAIDLAKLVDGRI